MGHVVCFWKALKKLYTWQWKEIENLVTNDKIVYLLVIKNW